MLSPHYSLFDNSKKRQELNKNKEYTSNMRGNAGFRVRRKSRSETPSPPPSPSFLNTNADKDDAKRDEKREMISIATRRIKKLNDSCSAKSRVVKN